MDHRKLGFVLIAAGLAGLFLLPALGAERWPTRSTARPGPVVGPGWMGSGWMGSMHAWMHGSGPRGVTAPEPSPGAEELTVTAREFSFSPSELTVPAGTTVNLVLVNDGALPHDVTIQALGFSLAAAPGETSSAAVSVAEPGRYGFFCSVPGHREAGMTGVLVVE